MHVEVSVACCKLTQVWLRKRKATAWLGKSLLKRKNSSLVIVQGRVWTLHLPCLEWTRMEVGGSRGECQQVFSGPVYRRGDAAATLNCLSYVPGIFLLCMPKPQIVLSWMETGRRTSSLCCRAVVMSCAHWRSGVSYSDYQPSLSANKLQKRGQQTRLLIAGLLFVWQISCNSRSRLAAFWQLPLAERIAWRLEVASFWSPASCWSLLTSVGMPQQAPSTFLSEWPGVPGWAVLGSWCCGCATLFAG